MARGDLIKQILDSYQRGDDAAFRSAASEVIDDERRKHHELLADELQEIMAPELPHRKRMTVASLRPLPKARNEAELVELINPRRMLDSQVLRTDTSHRLREILDEHQRGSVLRAHGLSPSRSLLLVGPPGTGKTSTAEAIASSLGVPMARVNIPAVVSSLLGETARNLAAIFEAARTEPWVLLFDEFDALGRERSDASEHGELKRVVSTFVQLVDDYVGPALIVAATNHPAMLDEAVWRRFDDVLAFRPPTQREIESLVRRQFRRTKLDPGIREVAQLLKGWTQADVELACRFSMKRSVLRDGDSVARSDIEHAIRRLEERRRTIRTFRA